MAPLKTKSTGPPIRSAVSSCTGHSTRRTEDPSASAARRKPRPSSRPHSRAVASSRSRLIAGHSADSRLGTSIATTSAPRRSISKAQKPSKVPMSSARLPARPAGRTLPTVSRRSIRPGVTTPGASSIVWYQSGLA